MLETILFSESVLSERLELIKDIRGSVISGLVRYSLEKPKEIAREIEEQFNLSSSISKASVFRRTYGPLLLTLDSGTIIGFGSIESQGSVSVWIEKTSAGQFDSESSIMNDDEYFPIDASDLTYSEKIIQELIGQRVDSVKIIRNEELYSQMGVAAEVGLSLTFENNCEIIISHNISENIDSFAIITRNEIRPEVREKLQEGLIV
jgi:hypothetical protein